MAKGINRSIKLPQPSIFGRIGTGMGQGLAESLPKEIERSRLASGLQQLGEQQGLSPFQQFAGLASLPGANPQIIQSGSDLLRQQALIDSIKQSQQQQQAGNAPQQLRPEPKSVDQNAPASATTTQGTSAILNPYTPPTADQRRAMINERFAQNPQRYNGNIAATAAEVDQDIAANIQKSNADIAAEKLKEGVQTKTEQDLDKIISRRAANVPTSVLQRLHQNALKDVIANTMSPDAAAAHYGEEADKISRDFSNIESWGQGFSLLGKDTKEFNRALTTLQHNAKKGGYQKEAADYLIAKNGVTPQFAYAAMYPIHSNKVLNNAFHDLEEANKKYRYQSKNRAGSFEDTPEQKNKILSSYVPALVESMGTESSPLAIAYELDKRGYDSNMFMDYLKENIDTLNLSRHQLDEMQKLKGLFYGRMADLWFKEFTGVK